MSKKKLLKSELVNPVRVMYAHSYPKSAEYRKQLEPFIGMEITVSGTYDKFAVKGAEECEETYMLLCNVSVVKSPRLSGKIEHTAVNHMWIMCPDDYVVRNKFRKGDILHCKGFVYEYVKNIGNNPVRNIGLNLISTKKKKPKRENAVPTVNIQAKKKPSVQEYECEITVQIEDFILKQGIMHFCDLTSALHEYPVLHEIVIRNPEYFRAFVESFAEREKGIVTAEPVDDTHIVKISDIPYDLAVSSGKTGYKAVLQKMVESYMSENAVSVKNPKEKFYIIGNGEAVICIQDSKSKGYSSVKKLSFAWGDYQFIDVCRYEANGSFHYRHFDLQNPD